MNLQIKRHLIQICASILYNGRFFDAKGTTLNTQRLCVPGLNCQYCPGALAGCPLGAIQSIFAGSWLHFPFYLVAIILLFALVLGRTICGWLCPLGFIFDLVYNLPSIKVKKNNITAKLSYLKYVVFAICIVIVPMYIFLYKGQSFPAFCEELCPNGLINALLMMATGTGFPFLYSDVKLIITLALIIVSIFIYRPFCRFFCPLGAFYAVFNKLSIFTMQIDITKCIGCNACKRACPMDCQNVGDRECIACNRCKAVCPTKAIKLGIRRPH